MYRGYDDSLAGVWVATPDGLETRLTTGWEHVPLGWTGDGRSVLLIRVGRPEVYAVDARGGPLRNAFTLPFDAPEWTGLSLQRDGTSVLYTRFRDQRDLWVVKRLDGEELWW